QVDDPAALPDALAEAAVVTGALRSGFTDAAVSGRAAVRSALYFDALQQVIRTGPDHLRDGPLRELRAHDAERGTEYALSVAAWCTAGFDVAEAARTLDVHPNTLRYRMRR